MTEDCCHNFIPQSKAHHCTRCCKSLPVEVHVIGESDCQFVHPVGVQEMLSHFLAFECGPNENIEEEQLAKAGETEPLADAALIATDFA